MPESRSPSIFDPTKTTGISSTPTTERMLALRPTTTTTTTTRGVAAKLPSRSPAASGAPHSLHRSRRTTTAWAASAEPENNAESKAKPASEAREDGFRSAAPIGEGSDEIYVGKPKGAKDGPETIVDDERLYPGKEDVGPLLGAVGGFAGGEVGLKNFASKGDLGIPETKVKEEIVKTTGKKPEMKEDFHPAAPIGKGKDKIYVGKPKGAKEVNDKTKYLKDDERLYPGKEDVGAFLGATGGFAGGEVGLKRFAEKGDIDIREEDSTGKPQPQSPLVVAFGLGSVAALGATVLNPDNLAAIVAKIEAASPSAPLGEGSATDGAASILVKEVDPDIALTVFGGLVVLSGAGFVFGQAKKLTEAAVETTQKIAVTSIFGFVLARIAIEILSS